MVPNILAIFLLTISLSLVVVQVLAATEETTVEVVVALAVYVAQSLQQVVVGLWNRRYHLLLELIRLLLVQAVLELRKESLVMMGQTLYLAP
jgi:hypothetical protein